MKKLWSKHGHVLMFVVGLALITSVAIYTNKDKQSDFSKSPGELVNSRISRIETPVKPSVIKKIKPLEKIVEATEDWSFEVQGSEESGITGIIISTEMGHIGAEGNYNSNELKGITISPSMNIKGRWLGPQEFVVFWDENLEPKKTVKLSIESLPLENDRILNTKGKKTLTYEIETPPLDLTGVSLVDFKERKELELIASFNYPVDVKKVLEKMKLILTLESGLKVEISGKKLKLKKSSENNEYRLILKDTRLRPGTLDFSFNGKVDLPGAKETAWSEYSLDLEAGEPFKIRRVSAVSSATSFTINLTCDLPETNSGSRYNRRQPKCDPDTSNLYEYISINPKVGFTAIAGYGQFSLVGDFKPNTEYIINVKGGLIANGLYVLDESKKFEVSTPGYKPSFSFKNKARYLPIDSGVELVYEARNVRKVKVEVNQIYPQNIIFWLSGHEYENAQIRDQIESFELSIDSKTNKTFIGEFELGEYSPKGKGVYSIDVRDPNNYKVRDKAHVVITDIGAIARKEKNDIVISTFSLDTLAAKTSVNAEVYSFSNKLLGKCTTSGSAASCRVKNVVQGKIKPFAIILKTKDDLSYLAFKDLQIQTDKVHAGTRSFSIEGVPLEGFVYSERGVYRPGERVNLAAIIRTSNGSLAKGQPLHWKVKSPKNKIIKEVSSNSNDFGASSFSYKTSGSFQTGAYIFELYSGKKIIGKKSLMIEDFVPERIGIKISKKRNILVNASNATFDVQANYLFGPPVAKGDLKAFCTISKAYDHLPNNKQYKTGSFQIEKMTAIRLEAENYKLDKNGNKKTDCEFGAQLSSGYQGVMRLNFGAEVREAGSGRSTVKGDSVLLVASEHLPGVKLVNAKDSTIEFEAGVFNTKGELVKSKKDLRVSLFQLRREWYYSTNRWGSGSWVTEKVLIPIQTAKSIKYDGKLVKTSFKTSHSWGQYIVRVQDASNNLIADTVASLGWYWGESDSSSSKVSSPDELKIRSSKASLQEGEEFDISFEAPYSGRALISIETDTIHHEEWVDVEKGQSKFSLAAPNVLPNFYVNVLVLKNPKSNENPNDYVPARAWGGTSIKVIPDKFVMAINVEAKEITRGDRDLNIKISNDKNIEAEYTIAVVDEGILQLTNFKSPSPEDFFFDSRALGVELYDTFGWTFSKTSNLSAGGGGGADEEGGRVMPVKLVSYWKTGAKSDSDGNLSLNVPLPPFQGKVRIMVVGISEKGQLGNAEKFTKVRDPIVLQPTLPRFLAMGDEFKIPVNVINMTGKNTDITVEIKAENGVSVKVNKQKRLIENDQSVMFYFPVSVKAFVGQNKFEVFASGGGQESKDYFTLPIIPPTPEISHTVAKKLLGKFSLEKDIPADFNDKTLTIDATLASMPHMDKLGHIKHLIRYPYGCIEQTTSSTYPLLFAKDILKWVDPDIASKYDINDMVTRGIDRIFSMQTSSGGFSYWPGASEPNLWGTAYAVNMLLDAKRLGYAVPKRPLEDAIDFLQSSVRENRHRSYISSYLHKSEPFVIAVLAKAGRQVRARIQALISKKTDWSELTQENTFLLAMAAKVLGYQDLYNKIFKPSVLTAESSKGRSSTNTFWSSIRTDGLRLSFIEDYWPGDDSAELLANKVAGSLSRSSIYYSTQEIVWGVVGLGKRLQTYKAEEIKNPVLKVNGKALKPHQFANKSPVWNLGIMDYKKAEFDISYSSKGKAYLYLKMNGHSKTFEALPADANTSVSRNLYDISGNALDIKKIKQGDLVVVELNISSRGQALKNLALVDRVPSGFEIENPRLGRGQILDWVDTEDVLSADYVDMKDDRIQIFGSLERGKDKKYYYIARAVTEGTFTSPPSKLELMYDPERISYGKKTTINIVR